MLRSLLDCFWPPLCMHCRERTHFAYLCEHCWQESLLLDPTGRCLHCFDEIAEPIGLCNRCRHKPRLPFPRAALFAKEAPITCLKDLEEASLPLSAFAFYQHARLDWKEPDLVAPIPPHRRSIARGFGELAHIASPNLFQVVPWPLYPRRWKVKEQLLEEETVLLLIDEGCTPAELKMACRAVAETFVQHVYILSIID